MSAPMGELVLKFSADLQEIRTATQQMQAQLQHMEGEASKSFTKVADAVDGVANRIKSQFAGLAGAIAGYFTVSTFAGLVKGSIEAQAALEDVTRIAGGTIEKLSQISNVGKISGTSLDDIATAGQRMAKGLVGLDDETSKAGFALKFLGINARDAHGNFKQWDALMQEVANHLIGYQDSLGKTMIVQDLYGRGGARLLPLLHDLATYTEVQSTVTTEGAMKAKEFEVSLALLRIEGDKLWTMISQAILPTLVATVTALGSVATSADGAQQAVSNLSKDGSLATWAENTIRFALMVAETLIFLGRNIMLVVEDLHVLVVDSQIAMKALERNSAAVNTPRFKITGDYGFSPEEAKAAEANYDRISGELNDLIIERGNIFKRQGANLETIVNGNAANLTAAFDKQLALMKAGQQAMRDLAQNADARDYMAHPAAGEGGASADPYAKARAAAAAAAAAAKKAAADAAKAMVDYTPYIDQLNEKFEKLSGADGGMSHYQAALNMMQEDMLKGKTVTNEQIDAVAAAAVRLDEYEMELKRVSAAQKEANEFAKAFEPIIKAQETTISNFADHLTDVVSGYTLETSAIGKTARAIKMDYEARKIDIAVREAQQKLQVLLIALDAEEAKMAMVLTAEQYNEIEARKKVIQAQIDQLSQAGETAKGIINANIQAQDSFASGWANAFAQYQNGLTGAAIAQKMFNDLSSSMENLFVGFAQHSKDAFKNFKDAVILMIEQIAAKLIVSGIFQLLGLGGGTFTVGGGGVGGGGGGAGSAGIGMLGNVAISAIGSYIGKTLGLESLFGSGSLLAGGFSGLATAFGNLATIVPTFTTLLESGMGAVEAASIAFEGMAASFAAVIPVIGAIVLAAYLVYTMVAQKKGGPKVSGAGGILSTAYPGETSPEANAAIQAVSDATEKGYNAVLKALGGTGTAKFGFAYSSDPRGTAPTELGARAWVNDPRNVVYSTHNMNVGRSPEELQAAIELESKRAILAALQASELPGRLSKILNSVAAATATSAQIDNALKFAGAIHIVDVTLESLKDPKKLQDAVDAVIKAGESDAYTAFQDQGEALVKMSEECDGSTDSVVALADATAKYGDSLVNLLAQIQAIRTNLANAFKDLGTQITLSTMSAGEKYAYYLADIGKEMELLATEKDPFKVKEIGDRILADYAAMWALMSPEQQAAAQARFLADMAVVQDIIDQRLKDLGVDVADSATPTLETVAGTFDTAVNKFVDGAGDIADGGAESKDAGQRMQAAADTMQHAADTLDGATINLQYPDGSSAVGSGGR